jgi:hypothetical protein
MSDVAAEMVVPDVIGEIVAYRAWRIVGPPQTPRLKSVTFSGGDDQIWPTNRWFPALCGGHSVCQREKNGTIPGVRCSCGLYAARSMEHLMSMGYAGDSTSNDVVIGEVGLVGKVIPGQQGWRAEKGRVIRLFMPVADYARGMVLGEAYNVDVEIGSWTNGTFKTLEEIVEAQTKGA